MSWEGPYYCTCLLHFGMQLARSLGASFVIKFYIGSGVLAEDPGVGEPALLKTGGILLVINLGLTSTSRLGEIVAAAWRAGIYEPIRRAHPKNGLQVTDRSFS
jgi:hypothetical protein